MANESESKKPESTPVLPPPKPEQTLDPGRDIRGNKDVERKVIEPTAPNKPIRDRDTE